jgi:hypothetical protein
MKQFFKVAPLPLALCAVSYLGFCVALWFDYQGPAFFSASFGCLMWFDALARWRDYEKLTGELEGKTSSAHQHAILLNSVKRFRHSNCTRRMLVVVADDFGRKESIKKSFSALGYRWWHLFPDRFPVCLFKRSWWRAFNGV